MSLYANATCGSDANDTESHEQSASIIIDDGDYSFLPYVTMTFPLRAPTGSKEQYTGCPHIIVPQHK